MWCVRCIRAAEKLLEAGADYTIHGLYNETAGSPRRRPPSLTPMMVAARRQCPALVEVLAERGADPMARDEEGRTALMVSLYYGDDQSAAYLLSHHPEGEQTHSLQDVHGCSCLHYVSSCRHQEGEKKVEVVTVTAVTVLIGRGYSKTRLRGFAVVVEYIYYEGPYVIIVV